MAVLSVQAVTVGGITPSTVAASSGGDSFPNTGQEWLYVSNGDGSPITVRIATPQTVDGLAVANRDVVVGATSEAYVGPFLTATYSDSVAITYTAVTSVTVAAFQLVAVQ